MTETSQFGRREFFVRAGVVGAAVVRFDAVDVASVSAVFGGEAYVRSSAPVVSTYDRMTNTIGSRLG